MTTHKAADDSDRRSGDRDSHDRQRSSRDADDRQDWNRGRRDSRSRRNSRDTEGLQKDDCSRSRRDNNTESEYQSKSSRDGNDGQRQDWGRGRRADDNDSHRSSRDIDDGQREDWSKRDRSTDRQQHRSSRDSHDRHGEDWNRGRKDKRRDDSRGRKEDSRPRSSERRRGDRQGRSRERRRPRSSSQGRESWGKRARSKSRDGRDYKRPRTDNGKQSSRDRSASPVIPHPPGEPPPPAPSLTGGNPELGAEFMRATDQAAEAAQKAKRRRSGWDMTTLDPDAAVTKEGSSGDHSLPAGGVQPLGQPYLSGLGAPNFTINIKQSIIPRLVGKGGEIMKEFEKRTGATVKMDNCLRAVGVCVCRVFGPTPVAKACADLIRLKVASIIPVSPAELPEGYVTEELIVEQKLIGLVLGKGGEGLRKLQDDSGAIICFYKDEENLNYDGKPRDSFHIVGKPDIVARAKKLMKQKMDSENSIVFGGDYWDPDEVTVPMPGEAVYEIKIEQAYVGRMIGRDKSSIKPITEATGTRIQLDQSTKDNGFSVIRIIGVPDQAVVAYSQLTRQLDKAKRECERDKGDWTCEGCGDVQFARNRTCRKCGAEQPLEVQALNATRDKIPDDEIKVEQKYVGFVIGPGGQTLKNIKEQSGAKVFIDQETKDKGFSIIRIGQPGTQQNMMAHKMINEKLAECRNLPSNRQTDEQKGNGGSSNATPVQVSVTTKAQMKAKTVPPPPPRPPGVTMVAPPPAAQSYPGQMWQAPEDPGQTWQVPEQPRQMWQATEQPGQMWQALEQPGQMRQAPEQPALTWPTPEQPRQMRQAPEQPAQMWQAPDQHGQMWQALEPPGQMRQAPARPKQMGHAPLPDLEHPGQMLQPSEQAGQMRQAPDQPRQMRQAPLSEQPAQIWQAPEQPWQMQQALEQPRSVTPRVETTIGAVAIRLPTIVSKKSDPPSGETIIGKVPIGPIGGIAGQGKMSFV